LVPLFPLSTVPEQPDKDEKMRTSSAKTAEFFKIDIDDLPNFINDEKTQKVIIQNRPLSVHAVAAAQSTRSRRIRFFFI